MPTISKTNDNLHGDTGQETCPLCGGLGYVRESVPIADPRFGQLYPCECTLADIAERRRERLRSLSNLDHMARMTFDTFKPEGFGLPPVQAANLSAAFESAMRYAENPKGWLALFGGYGCGKTHLAAAVANDLMERGYSVLFVVVPDLLDYLRATFGPNSPVSYDERFEEVRSAPVLILDDLGTQSSTPWALEKLFQILNFRYNARLPTVITSNQNLEDIDLRIRSRMLDIDLAQVVPIKARDFRGAGVDQGSVDLSTLSLMQALTFESFDLREGELPEDERASLRQAFEKCYLYAKEPQGWLILSGVYGCGKTHLASGIANFRVAMGEGVLFIVVPDLLDHLRATFSPTSQARFDRRFEEIKTIPLLVLDDLGTESASPWAREKLYQLFNYRYVARLPTVITTSDLPEKWDPRLRTRMLDKRYSSYTLIRASSFRGSLAERAGQKARGKSRRGGR